MGPPPNAAGLPFFSLKEAAALAGPCPCRELQGVPAIPCSWNDFPARGDTSLDTGELDACEGVSPHGEGLKAVPCSLGAERKCAAAASSSTPRPDSARGSSAPRIVRRIPIDAPVGGDFYRAGQLSVIDLKTKSMRPWTIVLFQNGFYAVARLRGVTHSFCWSPFSLVREETLPKGVGEELTGLPIFTLQMVSQSRSFVFTAEGAEDRRRAWVDDMARALRTYTSSFFPAFSVVEEPLPDVPETASRILAGYLLFCMTGGQISVPYCELHAPNQGTALFVMYVNEHCERRTTVSYITASTAILDHEGVDSSCFSVDGHLLCARSYQEKHLWLRVIAHVKLGLSAAAFADQSPQDLRLLTKELRFRETQELATIAQERVVQGAVQREASPLPAGVEVAQRSSLQQVWKRHPKSQVQHPEQSTTCVDVDALTPELLRDIGVSVQDGTAGDHASLEAELQRVAQQDNQDDIAEELSPEPELERENAIAEAWPCALEVLSAADDEEPLREGAESLSPGMRIAVVREASLSLQADLGASQRTACTHEELSPDSERLGCRGRSLLRREHSESCPFADRLGLQVQSPTKQCALDGDSPPTDIGDEVGDDVYDEGSSLENSDLYESDDGFQPGRMNTGETESNRPSCFSPPGSKPGPGWWFQETFPSKERSLSSVDEERLEWAAAFSPICMPVSTGEDGSHLTPRQLSRGGGSSTSSYSPEATISVKQTPAHADSPASPLAYLGLVLDRAAERERSAVPAVECGAGSLLASLALKAASAGSPLTSSLALHPQEYQTAALSVTPERPEAPAEPVHAAKHEKLVPTAHKHLFSCGDQVLVDTA